MPYDAVPFPRTVPYDAPDPPDPLLDQRAARTLFAVRRRENQAIGYRLARDGVAIQYMDGREEITPWPDTLDFARERYGLRDRLQDDDDDDSSRRERRQERRRERREDRGDR